MKQMIYLSAYNALFNGPEVKEPEFKKEGRDAFERQLNYELEKQAYNLWKQSEAKVVGEHSFQDGQEVEEGKDFELDDQFQSFGSWHTITSGMAIRVDAKRRTVATPIQTPKPEARENNEAGITVEQLLIPRRRVMINYPDSPYKVGDILFCNLGTSWYDQFPEIFKTVEWWEERRLEEMPHYVKFPNSFHKEICVVSKWCGNSVLIINGNFFYLKHSEEILPATKSEYEAYIQQTNNL